MNKPVIIGAALLFGVGCFVSSCSSSKSNNSGSGGADSSGGSGATGGAAADAGSDVPAYCKDYAGGIEYDPDGGVTRYGASDPADSLVLDVGAYYSMPGTSYHGYCYTFSDSTDNTVGGTSKVIPPCGTTGPCYTVASGLCSTMDLDVAKSNISWGGGIGCSLHQAQTSGSTPGYTDLIDKSSLRVGVAGCKVPKTLQVGFSVSNPPYSEAGVLGDGIYCNQVKLPAHPDANGVYEVSVPLTNIVEDCWNGLKVPALDPANNTVTNVQVQVNSDTAAETTWDFCITKLLIE